MKRHELDVVSLVFGLLFAAVVVWWAFASVGRVHVPLGWPLAIALLIAGFVGLIGALPRPSRPDADEVSPEPDGPSRDAEETGRDADEAGR